MTILSKHIDQHLDLEALAVMRDYIVSEKSSIIPWSDITPEGELVVRVRRAEIVPFLRFLRDDKKCQFRMLLDVCGVDWLEHAANENHPREDKRFDVVYHLLSLNNNMRIRVKLYVADGDSVPSVTEIFDGANWYERETFDMFGIPFENHPDLRRILTDYDFDGYPLRKDFPLVGHTEVYYDTKEKRVAYKPVDLPQEYRGFDFVSPWQGMDDNKHLADQDAVFDKSEFEEGDAK